MLKTSASEEIPGATLSKEKGSLPITQDLAGCKNRSRVSFVFLCSFLGFRV